MVMTGSRGALLGLLLGLVVAGMAASLFSRKPRFVVTVAASLALLASGYLALRTYAWPHPELKGFWAKHDNLSRLFEWYDFGLRLPSLTHSFKAIEGHRPFGLGPGNYDYVFSSSFHPKEACNERALNDAHNILAQVLTTQGVFGLLSWLFFFGVVLTLLVKQARAGRLGPAEGGVVLGWAVGAQVPNLFNPDSLAAQLTFFFLCALVFAQTQPFRLFQERTRQRRFPLLASLMLGGVGVLWSSVFPALASRHALEAVRRVSEGKLASPWPELLAASKWPTPYLEEQLIAGSTHILHLSESGVLKKFPLWEQLLLLQDKTFEVYRKQNLRIRMWLMQANTLNWEGKATDDARKFEQAEALFQEALAVNPARQEVLFAYAHFLTGQKRLDEAEALLRKAIEVEPSYGQAHFRLGVFLWQQRGRPEEGAEAIVRSRRTSCLFLGEEVGEVAQLAQAFFVKGDGEGLKAMALRARDFRPARNTIGSYLEIAEFLTRAGFPSEARELLAEVEQKLPGVTPAHSP
jgi:tetratricopeptide (TPR) repeat protein